MEGEKLLHGKTAVVTGAGRNVGRGIAERLASHGATVGINDIDETRAKKVIEQLPSKENQNHKRFILDGTDPEAVRSGAKSIENEFDNLDILVNNLGYAVNKNVFDTSIDEWHQVLDLTLTSGFLWTKFVGQQIADSGGGSIINIASVLGHQGQTNKLAYCAAKGGIVNMTRQLALDLADYNIRVNSITPSFVGDPVGSDTGREERDPSVVPLGRLGKPEDIGDAAVYLSSALSDYVTGADIRVTGGL